MIVYFYFIVNHSNGIPFEIEIYISSNELNLDVNLKIANYVAYLFVCFFLQQLGNLCFKISNKN